MIKDPLIEQLYKEKLTIFPNVIISGSGDAWYLNPDTRSMQRVYRGSVVKKISVTPDNRGRHLVAIGTSYMLIPEEELFLVGDN